jgi:AAA+ ATPase superfamily predicted ATPase
MFIGRDYEQKILQDAKDSKKSELIIIYGRRRVGKSTLIDQIASNKQDYSFEAIRGLSKTQQINHFLKQMAEYTGKKISKASNWEAAFDILTPFISSGKHIVVFDEFPWMASEKTELVSILKYYWDRKWKKNPNLKLILCGSVTNFMLKHLIHSEALHNRKTVEMRVDPLPAREAKAFFKGKRSEFEICKFLMIFGGIPKYLEQIDVNRSLEQNLDLLCFTKSSFFVGEFVSVFKEQFKTISKYEAIVEQLSSGMKTKEELQVLTNSSRGGGFGTFLDHLEVAGFIRKDPSLSFEEKTRKSKTIRYELWDEWLRFYFTYIKRNSFMISEQTKAGLSGRILSNSIDSYFGRMFEVFCRKNISQILSALAIDPSTVIEIGPYFRQFHRAKNLPGVQIDLCILRKGKIVTLIECKFREAPIGVDIIKEVDAKISALKIHKNFSLEKVLISASGVTNELDRSDYFHRILGLHDLFG